MWCRAESARDVRSYGLDGCAALREPDAVLDSCFDAVSGFWGRPEVHSMLFMQIPQRLAKIGSSGLLWGRDTSLHP